MDLVSVAICVVCFAVCLASLLLIYRYGLTEQRFEDGLLIDAAADKKKDRKRDHHKKDDSATADAKKKAASTAAAAAIGKGHTAGNKRIHEEKLEPVKKAKVEVEKKSETKESKANGPSQSDEPVKGDKKQPKVASKEDKKPELSGKKILIEEVDTKQDKAGHKNQKESGKPTTSAKMSPSGDKAMTDTGLVEKVAIKSKTQLKMEAKSDHGEKQEAAKSKPTTGKQDEGKKKSGDNDVKTVPIAKVEEAKTKSTPKQDENKAKSATTKPEEAKPKSAPKQDEAKAKLATTKPEEAKPKSATTKPEEAKAKPAASKQEEAKSKSASKPDEAKTAKSASKPEEAKPKSAAKPDEAIKRNVDKQEEAKQQQTESAIVEPIVASKQNSSHPNAGKQHTQNNSTKKKETSVPCNASELISVVKKMSLQDNHIQQLIDILLNKHNGDGKLNGFSGFSNADSGWMGGDKQNEKMKLLQRHLNDKDALLSEEVNKVKSLAEKLNALRSELNLAKSGQIQAQKIAEEVQNRSQQRINQLEGRLKQEMDHLTCDVSHWKNQAQIHLQHSQQLQATLDRMQSEGEVKEEKIRLEEDLALVKQQLQAATADLANLQAKHEAALMQVKEEAKHWVERCTHLEGNADKEGNQMRGQIEELGRLNHDLESRLSDVASRLKHFEAEASRLNEENERLSEQLAANVERPRADGQEESSNIHGKSMKSQEQQGSENQEAANAWRQMYDNVKADHEKAMAEQDVIIKELRSTLSTAESKLAESSAELEIQKAKNNELRSKNWKVVDALKSVEDSYQKLLHKTNDVSPQNAEAKAAVMKAAYQEQRCYLKGLFPMLDVKDVKSDDEAEHQQWLSKFEQLATKHLSAASSPPAKASLSHDQERLENQVKHYKSILAQTEDMLNKLQCHVESEENRWKDLVTELKTDLDNKEHNFSIERQNLSQRIASLEAGQSSNKDCSQELAHLQQQVTNLSTTLESEQKAHKSVCDQAAKLNQLLSTAQEALQQEKRTSDKLRLQLLDKQQQKPIVVSSVSSESIKNGSSECSHQPEGHVE